MLSFVGFAVGIYIGAALAPFAGRLFEDPVIKTLASLGVVFGLAGLLAGLGRQAGLKITQGMIGRRVGYADAGVGAGLASIAMLIAVWLVGSMLTRGPLREISEGVHESEILGAMNEVLPPAPGVVTQIRRFFDEAGFPDVFAGLEPAPEKDVPLPDDPQVQAAVSGARQSTVRIVGNGCGGILTGSGFVAAPGTVITNAHVVAGIERPQVEDRRGRHRAVVVHFDPNLDLAILKATNLAGRPLSLRRTAARPGEGGGVLGFPGGGPFTAVPAGVIDEITAVGRDIYSSRVTQRRVVRLRAEIREGNSGGPAVLPSGEVFGVVFSRSAFRSDLGYAIASRTVATELDRHGGASQPTDTGRCAA